MKKHAILIWIAAAALMLLAACSSGSGKEQVTDGEDMDQKYNQISQEEAMAMMAEESGYVILDVRTVEEYNGGHIPGAICIPNESIGSEQPAELPDLEQIILVYCRSGNRSKQAAEKLCKIGYTNIYEFGGINSWTGDVVTE